MTIIISSMLLSQDPPEEFQYNQSTLQAFYFFTDVTLNGIPIESDDWVAAFKGEICVGAREWDTSVCGGGICDVPALGYDGSEYSVGYMEADDIPTFKVFDSSTGLIFDAIPSSQVDPWSTNGFSMNDLLEALEVINGCIDNTACNYDPDATESCLDCCIYLQDGECDCEGNIDLGCGCGEDGPSGCDEICGSISENDECGECGGNDSTCTGCMDESACNFDEANIIENNEECEYPEENYDCAGGCTIGEDCLGICGGSAIEDDCGICDGDSLSCIGCSDNSACNYEESATIGCNDCCNYAEENYNCEGDCIIGEDCLGVCGGSAIEDDCGVCDGGSLCTGEMDQGQCKGEYNVGVLNDFGFDCAGYCYGTFNHNESNGDDSCLDCAGSPDGDAWESDCGCVAVDNSGDDCDDCIGVPYGDAVLDVCGVCNGDGLSCQYGCTDINATNYYCDIYSCENNVLPFGFIDDNSCAYNIEGTIGYFDFTLQPIENVEVTMVAYAFGLPYTIDSDSTDSNGNFVIPNVPIYNFESNFQYEYYHLEYSYSESVEDSYVGINNTDAILIANVVVSLETFPYDDSQAYYSSIAADVNLDGIINSSDSSLIVRFLNGTITSMNSSNIKWKFVSQVDEITADQIISLSGDNSILVRGIKLGDPNGDW